MDKQASGSPFLGVYIILRDAEKTIRALLGSIEDHFDEVVIVDTGSTDSTREMVVEYFGLAKDAWMRPGFVGEPEQHCGRGGTYPKRLVLAQFKWVDDFSAARNFAFSLGTAKWRMYLDADDVFDDAHKLRPTLERTDREHPEANCISLKYEYVPNEMPQDVIRCVRWADGWTWEDPLHEHLAPIGHTRVISKYLDIVVHHRPPEGHSNRSFDRNVAIAEHAYGAAATTAKRALWAYYLGDYAAELEQLDRARNFYREAADGLGATNLAAYALVRWARMELRAGDHEKALQLAGEAAGKAPELPDPWAAMGIANALLGRISRAQTVFAMAEAKPSIDLESMHDAVFLDGLAPTHAAQVALQLGQLDVAERRLARVPQALHLHPDVRPVFIQVHKALMQARGVDRLQGMMDYYLWDAQPTLAMELLDRAPAAIAHLPRVAAMRRALMARLPHLQNWAAYKAAYASIPPGDFHTDAAHVDGVKRLGRARAVVEWASKLEASGSPVEVLAIGAQDCIIEAEVMKANSRIQMTVCDVAPQAARGIQWLKEQFPDRVTTHTIQRDHYDWAPQGARFDAIFIFEVLEHLPSTWRALEALRELLAENGTLFLSTPNAEAWVEPYLTDPVKGPKWFGHVTAFNPVTLHEAFRTAEFSGEIFTTDGDAIFLAKMQRNEMPIAHRLSILIPSAAAFDPLSLTEGHLGGSEEAVVHLASELQRGGFNVTVYCNVPARSMRVRTWRGVAWRPVAEFDADGAHSCLLVWRSPQVAAQLSGKGYRVFNWLHDTHYTATPEQYRKVAGNIILSNAHAAILTRLEAGPDVPTHLAQNGIDVASFPPLVEVEDRKVRDSHRVIYASSPDRGLIHLLSMWPSVRKEIPDAKLDIFYSWDGFRQRVARDLDFAKTGAPLLDMLDRQLERLKEIGVTYHGGVSHPELHAAFRRASVWAYPTDFYEISCITAMKAQASGCWPLVTALGALPETVRWGRVMPTQEITDPETARAFCAQLISFLRTPPAFADRASMSQAARERFSWEHAAEAFARIFTPPALK